MQVEIKAGPAFAFGEITLPPGGATHVEAGAMASMRGDVKIQTSARGGILKGLKRALGGASFFVNEFTSASGGTVGVAGLLPGDMAKIPLPAQGSLLTQSGAWIASDPSVDVDSAWGGAKTFFSGEGLILLRCSGQGDVLVAAYGALLDTTLAPGESMVIDTGHVVAFDDTVQFSVSKAGNWKSTIFGGEGLVTTFVGPGRVWMQTRNTSEFVSWIVSKVPRPSSS